MTEKGSDFDFNDVEIIIDHPDYFKKMLAIGDDAYALLRLKNKAVDAWNILGNAGTAAVVAKSSVVASAFFTPSGVLSVIGIGTAVTPIGWVIAAGVIGGGATWGITQYFKGTKICRVDKIPEFINTPLDALALGIFDLLAPICLKVAQADGVINDSERSIVANYFIKKWGYNKNFIEEGLDFSEARLSEISAEEMVVPLAIYTAANPDCNYKTMSENIVKFLYEIADSDNKRTAVEISTIKQIKTIFFENDPSRLKNKVKNVRKSVNSNVKKIKSFATTRIKKQKQ